MKTASAAQLCALLLLGPLANFASCFEHTDETIDFHGPDVRPGYPDQFHYHYVLPKDTVSPNGKYGLILPDRKLGQGENSFYNFLVSLDPAQILARLDTDSPDFEGRSNGGYEVAWSKDSSVALITLESKWGPGEFFLIEFQDGKVSRTTNLDKKLRQLIDPDFRKAKVESFNDSLGFIYEYAESPAPFCRLENATRVKIDAYVTNDPKSDNPWRARVRAVWDIQNAKFTEQRLTRLANH